MTKIHKCIKEWNATVEALGQGLQTILIRKYEPPYQEFFLFPTSSYSLRDNFSNDFKKDYKSFVENNSAPNSDKSKIEMKFTLNAMKLSQHHYEILNLYQIILYGIKTMLKVI